MYVYTPAPAGRAAHERATTCARGTDGRASPGGLRVSRFQPRISGRFSQSRCVFLSAFLDSADALETMQSGKRRMLEMHPITEGAHILDVGCGIGHELQIHRAARVPHRSGSEPSATQEALQLGPRALRVDWRVCRYRGTGMSIASGRPVDTAGGHVDGERGACRTCGRACRAERRALRSDRGACRVRAEACRVERRALRSDRGACRVRAGALRDPGSVMPWWASP
jgi:hypothetical protein